MEHWWKYLETINFALVKIKQTMKTKVFSLLVLGLLLACNQPKQGPDMIVEGYEVYPIEGTSIQRVAKKHDTGKVIETGYLENGKKHGLWLTFNERDGRITTMTSYINGLKDGPFLKFNNREQIDLKANYEQDQLHGPYWEYQYGRILKEANYKHGKLDGLYKEYYNSGKILKEIEFTDGVQNAHYRHYDETGNVTVVYEYKDGEKVSGGIKK